MLPVVENAALLRLLHEASRELREVDVGDSVPRVHISQLSPLRFATQFAARNKPVIIKGALDGWAALRSWSAEYLCAKAGHEAVTVALTPTGRADAVHCASCGAATCSQQHDEAASGAAAARSHSHASACASNSSVAGAPPPKWFVTPCEARMSVAKFFQLLRASRHCTDPPIVPYVQHQNNSLQQEWAFLEADLQPRLSWLDEVFGGAPEATNVWIGDERSATSFHKDHFENMYAVVRGTKVFHLLPPCDVYRMHMRQYPCARWCMSATDASPAATTAAPATTTTTTTTTTAATSASASASEQCSDPAWPQLLRELGVARLVPQLTDPLCCVPWTEVDPEPRDPAQQARDFPLFHGEQLPRPLVAEVGPGDLLYLPALWLHRVSQRCSERAQCHDYVIAVNFWYDMAFDARWSHSLKLVEGLAAQLGL